MFLKSEHRTSPTVSIPEHTHCLPIRLWTPSRGPPAYFDQVIEQARTEYRRRIKARFDHLDAAVAESKWILELEDNFDGEGSIAYSERTWERAVRFLKSCAVRVWNERGIVMDIPRIRPGPSGSIDLHWKTDSYEFLVNVPSDPEEMATFYGDDYGKIHMEGSLDTYAYNSGLVGWLSKGRAEHDNQGDHS